jgi:hypothetical protein
MFWIWCKMWKKRKQHSRKPEATRKWNRGNNRLKTITLYYSLQITATWGHTHPGSASVFLWNNNEYTVMKLWSSLSWPRSPRHEMSSPAETLGSWVRILLEVWMSVFVLSFVGSGLATGWFAVHGVPPTVYKIKKLKWNGVSRMSYAPEGGTN